MPTTITGTDGTAYHLWQLPELSAPEPEDVHSFTVLENEMSEGYRTTQLFGLQSGLREWKLTFPTLAASTVIPAAVTDPYGATVSREQYVRNVYKYSRTTGIPFVYSDPNHNGQYYLVDAVDDELTMKKMKGVGIYGSELTFRQRRLPGVSVFDPTKLGKYSHLHFYDETTHGAGVWNDKNTSFSAINLTASGDVVFSGNAFNGRNTVRFSGSATTGLVSGSTTNPIYAAMAVMKIRTAPAGEAYIIHPYTALDDTANILNTASGSAELETPFAYLTITGNEDVDNQFAVVQVYTAFGSLPAAYANVTAWTIGAKHGGTLHAKADIGELWLLATPISQRDIYESAEHLRTKWDLA